MVQRMGHARGVRIARLVSCIVFRALLAAWHGGVCSWVLCVCVYDFRVQGLVVYIFVYECVATVWFS